MIRPARADDANALAALEREAFGANAWSREQVADELAGAARRVAVAEVVGEIVGYAAISVAGDVADLTRIVVADPHRRSGVASELLVTLHGAARQAGAERILLEVASSNAVACEFYRAHGYVEISHRRAYYADGDDALVLARALG
jgi:[ribosomal protein S18]-alanine N-acetyltransferase